MPPGTSENEVRNDSAASDDAAAGAVGAAPAASAEAPRPVRPSDPDAHPRGHRPGDDPFLPEEGFYWWLPRAVTLILVLLALFLAGGTALHHGDYRLAKREQDGAAILEKGRFRPWGWEATIPGGALDAWAPVAWEESVEAPLEGGLRDLADVFHGFLRAAAVAARGNDSELARLEAQEAALGAWYRSRWPGREPSQACWIPALRAEWQQDPGRRASDGGPAAGPGRRAGGEEAAAPSTADPRRARAGSGDGPWSSDPRLELALAYASDRRAVLRDAEDLLASLPATGQGTPDEERDRLAIESFIRTMDTPVLQGTAPRTASPAAVGPAPQQRRPERASPPPAPSPAP